jgi:tetratricopeptide (TPR) repeat protein
MTELVQALATLEADPTLSDSLGKVSALAQQAAQAGSEQAAAAKTALQEALKRCRERGEAELWLQLADLLLTSGLLATGSERADLLTEKGRVLSDDLLRDSEAEAAYNAALAEADDHEGAADGQAQLEAVRQNWQKIVQKLADEAKKSTDRQLTTGLYTNLGEITAKYNPGEAEAHWHKALAVEPRNRRASQHLERFYRGARRFPELIKVYEQRADSAATKEERVSALLSLADLYVKELKNNEAAVEAHKKALGIDPANARALAALVALYTARQDWQALIKLYEQALKARQRTESELQTVLEIGRLHWHKLKNFDQANEYYQRVRKVDPAHAEMLDFYRAYHGGRGGGKPTADDSAKLLQILTQAQKVEHDAARRLALGIEMAQVAEASQGGLDKAIDIWKSVLKLSPGHAEASAALKRLYTRTEKWNALLEMLKEQAEQLGKEDPSQLDQRIERLLEVVAIYRDRLKLDAMVINTYNTILQLKPDHLGALDALAQKYEAMSRWNDLIGVLQRKADLLGEQAQKARQADPSAPKGKPLPVQLEQARLLKRVAQLWIDKFSNHNQAVKPLEELYAIDPDDADTVARLRDIYNKRRSWRALLDLERRQLDVLEEHPERAPSAEAWLKERRNRLVELAKLAQDRLGDNLEAIGIWNRLLELEEGDDAALLALAALYERERRFPALIEVLGRQKARTKDAKAQVVLLERMGALLAEKLGAAPQAVEVYQEIVRLQPTHQKAMRTLRELYGQAGQYDELERLYGEQGQWEELYEVLLGLAERAEVPATKIDLYLRAARVAHKDLRSQEKAQRAYERVLLVDAQHLGAAQALSPIYKQTEKWPRLLAMYEILLGHAQSDDERLALMGDIATLAEEKLSAKPLAFSWLSKAYAIREREALDSSTRVQLEAELLRLASEADAWADLVTIYARQVPTLDEGVHKLARLRLLAQWTQHKLHRLDEARGYWEQVLTRAPLDEEALSSLEQIFLQQDKFPELLAIYRKRVETATDVQRRTEVLFKMAAVEENKLGDRGAAAATYRRILAEPETMASMATTMRALRALEKIYSQSGDHESLAEVLERQLQQLEAAQAERPERSERDIETLTLISYQLGELYELHLDRPERALERYRQVLNLTSGHRPTLVALERFLVPGNPVRVEVARLLVPAYERAEEDRKLAGALEIVLSATVDSNEELDLLRRLSGLVRRLGDVEQAYRFSGRLFERVPFDQENRRELLELAEALERQEDLAGLLAEAERAAARAGDHRLARDLAWDLGQLYSEQLHRLEEAEQAYARVLERDETHEGAARALEEIYRSGERFRELRALLERRKDLAVEPSERKDLLFQICDLDEGVLEDEEAAAKDYAEILELEPSNPRAFKALERLHTAAERWRDLDELLARAVPHVDSDKERAQLRYRRGELHANRLDDPDGACELLEEALSEQPKHKGARRALEALMTHAGLRQRIARTLEPLFEADGDFTKLVEVLRVQREALPEERSPEAAALMSRIALLSEEKLNKPDDALAAYREALRLDPADVQNRQNVERIATALGRFEDLAAAWEEAFRATDEDNLALRGELLCRAAELYDDKLADPERARDAWKRLLDLDPTSLDTAKPAAIALARLYQQSRRWSELIDVLRRQAEWAQGEERKALLFRVGGIQERLLSDRAAAIATYREILEGDATEVRALDALEALHVQGEQWSELIEILRRRVDLAQDGGARRDLLWRIAEVTEQKINDRDEAITAYGVILDERADDLPTLDALARLYEAAEQHSNLLEMLERRLPLTEASDQRVRLRVRMAALLVGPLRRPDAALDQYREILAEEPGNHVARSGLEDMLDDDSLRLRAAEVLEPIYQRFSDTAALVRINELFATYLGDVHERIARLKKVAELRAELKEPQAALEALARASRLAVTESELPELLDLFEAHAHKHKAQRALVELYREISDQILDTSVQERVLLTIAKEAYELQDRDTARDYYRRVLDATPDHLVALEALERIYGESHALEPLLEIYARRAELAQRPDRRDDMERRQYLLLSADLCERELGRPDEAIVALEQVLQLFPGDLEAAGGLERLYKNSRRWADLADLLERRLKHAASDDETVELRYRLGAIFEEELSSPERAVESYRLAISVDSNHGPSIAALERFLDDVDQKVAAAGVLKPVYEARGDWMNLIRTYEIHLGAAEDPHKRIEYTKAIAGLYEEKVGDLKSAFTWYGKVFREQPGDEWTRSQLARLAGELSQWQELAEIYQRYLDEQSSDSEPAVIDVLRTAAEIYDDKLDQVDAAKEAYRRLLAQNSEDMAAFERLEAMLTRAGRWHDLHSVYRDAVRDTLDQGRKKALLFKISALQEDKLSDPSAAVSTYREILDVDSDDEAATLALDRLYTDLARWPDLSELLLRRLERADRTEQRDKWIELKLRLGALYEEKLADLPHALDSYEEVLGRSEQQADAMAAMERLLSTLPERDALRFRIAQSLEPIYRRADAWEKLSSTYEVELLFIDDKPRRVELLREIAQLSESRGGDREAAFRALSRAFNEEASEGESRERPLYDELVRLAAAIPAWTELVGILEKAVESTYDQELLARVQARIAGIYDEKLEEASKAIEAWRRVTAVHDEDDAAWQNLERLLAKVERHAELVAVLEKRFTLTNDLAEQKRLLYQAAGLYETTLGQPERAVATWRQVLQLDESDREALSALARLYEAREQWRDLCWVYTQQIELVDSEAVRRPLRFAMAKVYEEQLGDSFEAIAAYKGALEADPRDAEALSALLRLYEREGQWADHLEALDRLAELSEGETRAAERLALQLRAARVTEEKIQEAEAAIRRYQQVIEFSAPAARDVADWMPTESDDQAKMAEIQKEARLQLERLVQDPQTRESAAAVLEPLYRRQSEWRPLIDLLELKLSSEGDLSERRRHLSQIAELYENGLKDPAAAFATWGRVLAEEPHDVEAVQQLERLAVVRGEHGELAALFEERLQTAGDPELSRTFALKLAALYETHLEDDARAIDRYRRVRELPGDEMEALQALDRLLTKTSATTELAEVLEREAEVAPEPVAQAEFLYRLGELRAGSLYDLDGALTAFRKALERHPQHAGARAAVERLISSPAHALLALELLEPLAEQERDFAKLVELLEVRTTVTQGKAERAALFERIAQLSEKELGDPSRAFDAVARAFVEMPEDGRIADEMERLARACGRDSDAAGKLEEVLERVTFGRSSSDSGRRLAGDLQRDLGLRAARIWERLSDDQRAETRYQTVLDLESDNQDALQALERIYRQRNDATLLAEMLLRRAALELASDKRKQLLSEAAALYQGPLADEFKAVEAYKKILELDETDAAALSALADLYQRSRRFDELVQVLQTQARLQSGSAKVATLGRIAELYSEELDAASQAIEVYREILTLQPTSLKALAALEGLYGHRGEWALVQEVLVRRLKAVQGQKDKVTVLRKLAQLSLERLNSADDAIGYLQQVLDILPSDAEAQKDLERLLEQAEKWYELVEVLIRHADAAHKLGEKDEEIALLLRAAEIWEVKVQAPEQAKKLLERVLERDPNHVRALISLARIYESQHDWARCKATLERAVKLARGSGEMAELYYRLGRMEGERLGEAAAEPYYERALQADPTNVEVAEALEKRARSRGDFRRVADLLAVRAERMSGLDVGKQKELLVELGKLYVNELKSPEGALPVLQRAYKLAPDDLQVIEPLAEIYFNSGRLREALPLYRTLVERSGKGRRSKDLARVHFRLAAIAEKEGDVHKALEQYNAAYSIDAGHLPTLIALGRLYMQAQDWEKARRIYRSMLLQNLDPNSGVTRADVYQHLGEIHEKLGEGPKAVGMYERGLELDPNHPGLLQAMGRVRG